MLKIRTETLEAAEPRPHGGAANDMDTSSAIMGKRPRDLEESPIPEIQVMGTQGKRQQGDSLATALAADMSVVHEHAQWWNPTVKPQV